MKKGLSWILFAVGFFGAILLGLLSGLNVMPELTWLPWVLVLLGIAIGLMNISSPESTPVMIATLVLGAGAGVLGLLPSIGGVLEAILFSITALALPVGIVVAIKTIYKSFS